MKLSFKLEGMSRLSSQLDKVAGSLNFSALHKSYLRKAQIIADDAKGRAPMRTGQLKSSIHAKELEHVVIAAVDRKKAPHAGLVEFGTSRTAAHPYFRPAVEAHSDEIAKGIKKDLKQAVERAAK